MRQLRINSFCRQNEMSMLLSLCSCKILFWRTPINILKPRNFIFRGDFRINAIKEHNDKGESK